MMQFVANENRESVVASFLCDINLIYLLVGMAMFNSDGPVVVAVVVFWRCCCGFLMLLFKGHDQIVMQRRHICNLEAEVATLKEEVATLYGEAGYISQHI